VNPGLYMETTKRELTASGPYAPKRNLVLQYFDSAFELMMIVMQFLLQQWRPTMGIVDAMIFVALVSFKSVLNLI